MRAGQPLIKADLKLIESKGYDPTTMLIVTEPNGKQIAFKPYGGMKQGDVITI